MCTKTQNTTINPAQAIDKLITGGLWLLEETVEDVNEATEDIITFVSESDQFAAMEKHKRSSIISYIFAMRGACLAIVEYREKKELKFIEEDGN